LVDEGSKVRIGQTLAIVRSEQITSDLNTAEAYQNALVDYNRFENAYSTGGVTKQQLD
jgi:multidrug efflux pump subunit AcrA (membrane-fusion protein)